MISRRDFLKGMVATGLALSLPKEIYALTKNQELSWNEIRKVMFYSTEGIEEYYRKELEDKSEIAFYYKPDTVYLAKNYNEYERVKRKYKSYVVGCLYVPSNDPRGKGDKTINEMWERYLKENKVPYGDRLDLKRSMVGAPGWEEDKYTSIASPALVPMAKYIIVLKRWNASWAFLEYINPYDNFQGKSFPEINGLSPHIFNMPRYLKWLKEEGKEIPKSLYPMALFMWEVKNPHYDMTPRKKNYMERRIDVIYWIEPTWGDSEKRYLLIMPPVLSLRSYYPNKGSTIPMNELDMYILYGVIDTLSQKIDEKFEKYDDKFKAILEPKR